MPPLVLFLPCHYPCSPGCSKGGACFTQTFGVAGPSWGGLAGIFVRPLLVCSGCRLCFSVSPDPHPDLIVGWPWHAYLGWFWCVPWSWMSAGVSLCQLACVSYCFSLFTSVLGISPLFPEDELPRLLVLFFCLVPAALVL